MNKITVVHMAEAFEVGGMERVVADIAEGLDPARYRVIVCGIARGGPVADELKNKGIEVMVMGIRSYYNPLNIIKLAFSLKTIRADIVHTHTYFSGTIGRLAARLAGTPVCISHVHSSYRGYSRRNILIERFLSGITDKIICVSNSVKEFVVGYEKIDPARTVVIYNGVDERVFPEVGETQDHGGLLLSIGSLFGHKGHRVVIQALSVLRERGRDVHYVLAGEGPERKYLEKLAVDLGVEEYVKFSGICNDVNMLLRSADIFIMPSLRREGLGIAMLEAMACGKPVIASRIGGIPEVINDGENGLLVEPGDVEALADAVEKILADEGLKKHIADNGKETIAGKFLKSQMVEAIASLYIECMTGKGRLEI